MYLVGDVGRYRAAHLAADECVLIEAAQRTERESFAAVRRPKSAEELVDVYRSAFGSARDHECEWVASRVLRQALEPHPEHLARQRVRPMDVLQHDEARPVHCRLGHRLDDGPRRRASL